MLDSHHHLWTYDPAQYPWIPPGSALARDYLIPQLLENTEAAGVTGTVAVQARQTIGESDWLLSLSDQCDRIKAVVGWVPLADDDVGRHLERLARHRKFKAVRHVVQDEPDDKFILGEAFNRGISQLLDFGLVYDILIFQKHLPPTIEFVDRHPHQPFVVDHIAKPVIHNGRLEEDWKKGMAALAERDNVTAVKISGMVTEVTDDELDETTLKNYFDQTLEMFGPRRLCFGTDWPVCLLRIDAYRDWADSVRSYVAALSEEEQGAILSETCRSAYRL
ncbi:MAG: amidohydrolase family protein [Akkermansiaceae bacterium]|nr:amidohydrolase family protein [Akkermansiaceae bacterium]